MTQIAAPLSSSEVWIKVVDGSSFAAIASAVSGVAAWIVLSLRLAI